MTTKIVECNGCGATISAEANARHQARQLGWRCLPEESTGGEIDFCAACVAATEAKIEAVSAAMTMAAGSRVDVAMIEKLAKVAVDRFEQMPAEGTKRSARWIHLVYIAIAGAGGAIGYAAIQRSLGW